ncbi:MAG: hypothetical protein IPK16_03050 [Anaerolineales bacterium]|nr:hypothetical protein [Anaerolineales bacterium]
MTSNSGIQFGWRWLAAALIAVVLTSGLVLMPQTAAAEGAPGQTASVAPQSQIFNDDLVVEDGQVLSGDVVVYSGDATVKMGERSSEI